MMKFALLASGSKGNCFLIQDADTHVLIDCGSTKKNIVKGLDENHITTQDIDGVVITHDHSDHIAQIRTFRDNNIYSPVEIDDIESFMVTPFKPFTIGSLRFMPLPMSHDARNTMGYIIDNGLEKLVYVTDTGYVNQKYFEMMYGAKYIVLESNHDVNMLMMTRRPQYLKQRIYGDDGHLNNEDCAKVLTQIISENTEMIILAHLSQEANTRELALQTNRNIICEQYHGVMNPKLQLLASGQFEMIRKGDTDEESSLGTVKCAIGREFNTHDTNTKQPTSTQ